VGYEAEWTEAFLKEAEGKPLKNIVLSTSKGSKQGDAMVTRYGIEGTPVYFVGKSGGATLDLLPDLDVERIVARLKAVKENRSLLRRVKKQLKLCPASFALVYHFTPRELLEGTDFEALARRLKSFPLKLLGSRPLDEAISAAGGLMLSELDEHLMLKRFPGIFAAGEMLDWDAPTGGFLIQACVSQGALAGRGIVRYLRTMA
jgi:hypothetical protein